MVIPSSSTNAQLEAILKGLLQSTCTFRSFLIDLRIDLFSFLAPSNARLSVSFDFLCLNELVRQPLEDHLREKDESLLESIIEIEYIEKFRSPEPEDALIHDDWIAGCSSMGDTILVACYDTKVHLWNNQGEHLTTLPGHTAPVKTVAFIHSGLFFEEEEEDLFIYCRCV